jgi:osmotically-inducible protein OsmY
MHKRLYVALAATLLSLAPTLPTALAKSPVQVLNDSTLATRTKAALADVNKTAAARLNIEVRKGKLQFGGFVETAFQKSEALRVGADMAGEGNVLDAIVILDAGRSTGRALDDTSIQARLKTALARASLGEAIAINTDVRNGDVLLSGFVGTESARAAAGRVAEGISGVGTVHNRIAVVP